MGPGKVMRRSLVFTAPASFPSTEQPQNMNCWFLACLTSCPREHGSPPGRGAPFDSRGATGPQQLRDGCSGKGDLGGNPSAPTRGRTTRVLIQ